MLEMGFEPAYPDQRAIMSWGRVVMKPLCRHSSPCRARANSLVSVVALAGLLAAHGAQAAAGDGRLQSQIDAHAAHGELSTRIAPAPVSTTVKRTAHNADADSGDAAQTEPLEKDPSWRDPRPACLNVRLLRDFRVIDDRHAVLFESVSRPYLVTFAFCPELRFAFRIVAASRNGRLCGGAGDRIFVRRFRCFVNRVERVSSPEHARYLVNTRSAARRNTVEESIEAPAEETEL